VQKNAKPREGEANSRSIRCVSCEIHVNGVPETIYEFNEEHAKLNRDVALQSL
jgi:hypothetical protein